jgi:hypothetical protein
MTLDKRQKILLPLIMLAFAYIVWQVYGLFFQSIFNSKENSQKRMVSVHHTSQPVITAEQSEYLRLVNRYNLLKLKHMLLEEEAAITAAKQRIVKSRSEISMMRESSDWPLEEDLKNLEEGATKASYELVYLDYHNGRWHALLNKGGRFFEVYPGIKLVNGDHILSVNKEGVILNHNHQVLQLTFDGSRLLSDRKVPSSLEAQKQLPEPAFLNSKAWKASPKSMTREASQGV